MKATTKRVMYTAAVVVLVLGHLVLGMESESFRVDARRSYGGHVGTGVEEVGEVDGSAVRGWDTTAQEDGWVTLESQGQVAKVCVLNEPAVEGGRMEADTTWGTDRLHLVRDDVVVGEGVVLTLERGTVVKFTEGARIIVEEGGSVVAKGAYLADAADDRVGGDTNLDGEDTVPGSVAWWLEDEVVGSLVAVDWVGGGEGLYRTTYSAGETYGALPVPEREDAIFGGWFTHPGGEGVQVMPDTRVDAQVSALYAKWTALSVDVVPASVAAEAAGGKYEVVVTANGAWSAESGAPWIAVDGAEGDGDGRFSLTLAANENTAARAAAVRVRMARGGAFRDVAVAQEGMEQVVSPVILPEDGTTFAGAMQRVVMSCATDGAEIRYTLDGSEPGESGIPYAGSFNVFDTTVVKAKAFKAGMLHSGTTAVRLVRLRSLAEAIDQPLWSVVTDEAHPWTVEEETTHDGEFAARSGAVAPREATRMETTVEGEGWLGFWWKVACEDDPDGTGWDKLSFSLDGYLVDAIDGDSGWMQVSVRIKGEGIHSLVWEYAKDWYDESVTEDAGWVDQVTWEPTVMNGDVPVSWLADLGLVEAGMTGEDAASADVDGDGYTAAQEFLAGTDPTDAASLPLVGLTFASGAPEVTWTPDLESDRNYRIRAKRALADADWDDVTDVADRSEYHFFTVEIRSAK